MLSRRSELHACTIRLLMGASVLLVAACGGPTSHSGSGGAGESGFRPVESDRAVFWDRQTSDAADELAQIIREFNEAGEGIPVEVVPSGNYGDIYRKVMGSIRAGVMPAMAVAYENMTAEYMRLGAVTPLDPYVADPEIGLTQEELDDYFPAMLGSNRFDQFDGQMLSFPYTKSVLVMYYNLRVMKKAGLTAPPETWDEFLEQCRAINAATGSYAAALDVDCSTVSGIIFSMGGDILGDEETLYDQPPSVKTFELYETLIAEELAYQIPPRTFNDETSFANDEIAFIFRTSAQRPYLVNLMEDPDAWGIAPIPQADPTNPGTALYGGNITVFKTTAEQQESAWGFVRHFTTPETTVRWALATGYLPVRRSAADHPDLQAFWNEWPSNRTAFDCLAYARTEPNILAWQEIRSLVENAQTAVIAQLKTGEQAAHDLKREADAVLQKRR